MMNDSEYKDFLSFYIYNLKQVDEQFEINFIKQINIPTWLAKMTFIKNWSYEKIKHETEKAFLLYGVNNKGDEKWISKTQLEIGNIITKNDEYYLAHRRYIYDKELEDNRIEVR